MACLATWIIAVLRSELFTASAEATEPNAENKQISTAGITREKSFSILRDRIIVTIKKPHFRIVDARQKCRLIFSAHCIYYSQE
jgi:hypothetical protein